ncbi:hypothetical protein PC116_g21576 [Phytophthora cactorum]|uniref:Uncharacterized protein n=1 Tax=Phytophthora cactorum TaxID=29920 RepID=A0A8T1BYY5_9STRA|nr:hypothetical protein PC114_g22493 [Phytophthora cactorum]KAG2913191.1 hypothetical protein PC117_g18623 [Phytophthora cactorum]KAG2977500.1 hypothetical protein PC119_g21933 [Phytophthora cactorum]KAG3127362.1 hypothetical protein C6341_g25001 [Phytophthora cactorum]KAG4042581.1 hypothetical protein PC123_g21939 [Phytophthora cactorum]
MAWGCSSGAAPAARPYSRGTPSLPAQRGRARAAAQRVPAVQSAAASDTALHLQHPSPSLSWTSAGRAQTRWPPPWDHRHPRSFRTTRSASAVDAAVAATR